MGRSDVAWGGEVWGFLFYWADELKKLGGLSYPATAQDGSGAAFGLLG